MRVLNSQVSATTKSVRLILDISPFDYKDVHAINDSLKSGDEIKIERAKEKRSMNANSFYWSVIGKIATSLRTANIEIHNRMLSDYGVEWLDGNGNRIFVQLPMSVNYLKEETFHVKPTSKVSENSKGVSYRTYVLLKPSHLYDTAEFSRLLDGAISEARRLGIEVEDDAWIEQIKSTWTSAR